MYHSFVNPSWLCRMYKTFLKCWSLGSFFSMCNTFIVCCTISYSCPVSRICCANLEFCLLVLMAFILYNVRVLDQFWSPVVRVTPLKTPFGLLISLLQSQSHVTTFTHNCFSRCATFTRLTILHVRNYNHILHSYTFTLADFSAVNYCLELSHTLHLHTSRVCLLSRPHS
jgi:hypothetical protein